jgi:hypothetical protein
MEGVSVINWLLQCEPKSFRSQFVIYVANLSRFLQIRNCRDAHMDGRVEKYDLRPFPIYLLACSLD